MKIVGHALQSTPTFADLASIELQELTTAHALSAARNLYADAMVAQPWIPPLEDKTSVGPKIWPH